MNYTIAGRGPSPGPPTGETCQKCEAVAAPRAVFVKEGNVVVRAKGWRAPKEE